MSSTPRRLAALVLAAVIAAGCADDAAETADTRTRSGAGAGRAEPAGGPANEQDRAVRFAECIREHGVPDFPDANADGEFVFGINVSPAVWTRAVEACKELEPPGALSAERSPEQQTASLRFADCMRANGVQDFPDPVNGEPLVDTTRIPSSEREGGMTTLDAAMAKCRGVMAGAAGGR